MWTRLEGRLERWGRGGRSRTRGPLRTPRLSLPMRHPRFQLLAEHLDLPFGAFDARFEVLIRMILVHESPPSRGGCRGDSFYTETVGLLKSERKDGVNR